MSIWKLASLFAFGPMPAESGFWLLHFLAFDPAWFAGRSDIKLDPEAGSPARLYYDGDCGLCHRTVRFILSEDVYSSPPLRIRFSPIGSAIFERSVAAAPSIRADELPDSIVLECEDGTFLVKSAAALEIARRLGGVWRGVAFVVQLGGLIPAATLDFAYDVVARNRKRIFAKPSESCPILPPHLRSRFDL